MTARPPRSLLFGAGAIIIAVGAFWSGDLFHGQVWNPLVRHHETIDAASLNDLYALVQDRFDGTNLSPQAALDGAKAGLVAAAGDPYTVYLTNAQAKELNDSLEGSVSGIGVEIGVKNGLVTVIAPVKGTPAEKAGIRTGDVITKINGQDATTLTADQAVAKITGKAGTTVGLTISRSGVSPINLTITRANITVPSVTWEMKDGNIGYIDIARFGPDTAGLMDQAATSLKSQGATRIVLDLRNDGGGYLDAGVAVASEFLPTGKTILSVRTGGKTTKTYTASAGGKLIGLKTIVLMNGGTASASEIVSGALHDNNAAKLYGEQSFGKGSVQEIDNLSGGSELKVTIAHWYTPGGVNIDKSGLTPDTKVALTNDDYNASRDPQLDAAMAALK